MTGDWSWRVHAAICKAAMLVVGLSLSVPGSATLISNNLLFGAFDQSPFATGGSFNKSDSTVIGPPAWKDITLPLGIFPAPNPIGFLLPNVQTSGQVGLEFGYAVSGGRLNFDYPVAATLALPDSARAGGIFSVNTTSAAKGDGFAFSQSSDIVDERFRRLFGCIGGCGPSLVVGPSISTTFPSATAYLDFFARSENKFKLDLTYLNPNPLDFGYKTKTLAEVGLPGFDERFTLLELNKSGVSTAIPGVSIPFNSTLPIIPDVLSAYIHYPDLATKGGMDASGRLVSGNEQTVVNLNLDVIGAARLALGDIIPPLKGSIDIGFGSVAYDILDVNSGLNLQLRQNFSMEVTPRSYLYFDTPVSALNPDGSFMSPSNIVALPSNGNLDLYLPHDLPRTSLTVQPFYTLDARLRNDTTLALNGYLSVEALSGGVDIGTRYANISESFGPLLPRTGIDGDLFSFSVFSDEFNVNVTPIWTRPFELGVDPPSALSMPLRATLIGHLPDGRAIYNVKEILGAEFSRDLGNFAGREIAGLNGAIEFLSELPITDAEGNNRGRLFCVFCPSAEPAAGLISSSSVLSDGRGVYFNDLLDDLFSPPAADANQAFLDAFILAHAPIASGTGTDARVLFSEDFITPLYGVPLPDTAALFAAGLFALGVGRRRLRKA